MCTPSRSSRDSKKSRFSRKQIQRSVEVSATRYADARITTYVPILVYRDTRAALAGTRERQS